jgi:hypothetical protein
MMGRHHTVNRRCLSCRSMLHKWLSHTTFISFLYYSSATSSAMILFTSLGSSSTYFVFGLILKDYAYTGFVIGFLSSLLGQILMRRARQATSASGRNFERNSYIAFVIGGVVLVSALLMTVQYVFLIVDQPDEGSIGGLCDGMRF